VGSFHPFANGGSVVDFSVLLEVEEPGLEALELLQDIEVGKVDKDLVEEDGVFFLVERIGGEALQEGEDVFEVVVGSMDDFEALTISVEGDTRGRGAISVLVEMAFQTTACKGGSHVFLLRVLGRP
jgi:hypothetical protein